MKQLLIRQPLNKKGVGFADMLPMVITFVIVGIAIVIGVYMISEINTQAGFTANSSAANATAKVQTGMGTFANMLPIIAIALVFAVIISIIVGFLVVKGKR